MIKISEIKITPIKPNNGLIAFCSFIVDACLYVGDIGLHYNPERKHNPYWLVYPVKTLFNSKRINIVHPINRETELFIMRAVVERYEEITKKTRENQSREEVWSYEKESYSKKS